MALLAAGGLAYEIALTRLLSALLTSSWVGPVLAVALLGVGVGAALAASLQQLRQKATAQALAASGAVFAVLSLPVWLWAVAEGSPLLGLAVPLLAYLCLGAASAAIISWHPTSAPSLLCADYGAAALAAAATPLMLSVLGLGVPGAMLVIAALPALAAVALATTASDPRAGASATQDFAVGATLLGVAAPLLAGLAIAVGSLEVRPAVHLSEKPISLALARGGSVEETRWDATARTDLVATPDGARYLYMDGGAGSLVATPDPSDWSGDVGGFAFAIRQAESAFLIGPGGGLDVAQARAFGVTDVVAVEVNGAAVEIVRDLGRATGLVYEEPTDVIVGDGRRVLAGTADRYDVITLANVVTGAAELKGAALTENLVYTVEAFEEYLSHLEPEGHLALKLYDELTLTRALTTALTALVRGGHAADEQAAMAHLLAVLDVPASAPVPMLIVRRSPFTREAAISAARVAEGRGWSLLLVPGLLTPPSLGPLASGAASVDELIASSADVDIAPTFDSAPYFFSFEPGVPRAVGRAGTVAAVVLVMLVALAIGMGAVQGRGSSASTAAAFLTSVWLGAGFLLVELAALPAVQLSVGHPTWSLSATLGAVLLGGAVGAWIASRTGSTWVSGVAALAAVTVAAWMLAAPLLSDSLASAPPAVSGLALGVTLMLACVPMGVPFPRLLRAIGSARGVAAALALSGSAAVAAGAGAQWLSHAVGTQGVAASAVFAYLLAAVTALGARKRVDTGTGRSA